MEIITSLENNKVKYWNKLNDKKFRDSENLFLVEGDHLIKEAYLTSSLVELIIDENYISDTKDIKTTYVTKNIMKKISRQVTPPKAIGIVKKFKPLDYGNRLIILDDIQDPGNLGTIIRSAVAFNIDTLILGEGCVDLYNAKTIRSSEGMIFHINTIRTNLEKFLTELQENNYTIFGTDVTNGLTLDTVAFPKKVAIIIGNEGQGISPKLKTLIAKNIYIPTSNSLESLNASVAASIIMYEMSKKDYE